MNKFPQQIALKLAQYSCFKLLFFILIIGCLWQCQNDAKPKPNVSDIEVEVEIKRFEQDLFALDTNQEMSFANQIKELEQAYPDFFVVFKELIAERTELDTSIVSRFYKFVTFESVRRLHDTTQIIFPDLTAFEQELETAFQYYKHYFPDQPIPEVVSYISEFSTGVFTYGDNVLGIGLDFFLGEGFPYDPRIFPAYLQTTMNKEHLAAKAIEAISANLAGEVHGDELLDYMIANGKTLYVKSLLLPDTDESILMEWTPAQTEWMNDLENQRILWTEINKRSLLFSARKTEFDKLIGPSPMGTTWMPPESPGKAGNWIGWQIVKAFMKNNPEVSVQELITTKDAQKILNESRYRPPRLKLSVE